MLKTVVRLSICAAWLASAACGGSSPSSPAAPTPSTPTPVPPVSTSGATIHGTVAFAVSTASGSKPARATDLMVSVGGTSLSATVAGDGTFTVASVPAGSVELRFSSNSVDARGWLYGIGDQEEITLAVLINGSTAQFTVQKSEAEGTISGLVGACPAVTFTVGAVKVSTTAATTFTGGTCQQLANSGKAAVAGTKQPDASSKATMGALEEIPTSTTPPGQTPPSSPTPGPTPPPNPTPTPAPTVDIEGTIGSLSGSCPTVTFAISGTRVSTDGTTVFLSGSCLQLANSGKARVTGTTQADGSLKATTITIEEVPEAQLEGTVSSLGGGCPALSFLVGTTRVTTDAATQFKGGACSEVATGSSLQIKGATQLDGSVKASEVSIKTVQETQLDGNVSGLTGACPTLRFTVTVSAGVATVTTNSATVFTGGSCSALTNGRRVQARGFAQSDGAVLATRVDLK